MPERLRPTLRHTRARQYLRPGGPWDIGSLAEVLDTGPLEPDVAAVAGALRSHGVRRRDAVAWKLPNCTEAALLYHACWRLGAVATPLHHAWGETDVERALGQVEARVVLTERARVRALVEAGAPPVAARDGAGRPADLAVALFTTGSTGAPKAVLHTHRGLGYKVRLMSRVHALRRDDCILMPAPLAHISGLLNAVLLPGASGMRAILMERWDPEHALEVIERERVTFMIGPPTFFVALMGASGFTPERVGSLRLVSCGGAGVTPAFVERASETLGCTVKRTYGSTEAPTVTTSHAGDPLDRARETDGRPTGEVELRVSVESELWLRGPELFVGYADEAQTRAAHARGGWFRTGDLAQVDGDGWLTVTGRMRDVIIRGGENISAAEVEAVLEAHPAVRQAVAVGEPDDRLGERVAAFVVTSAPFDLDACRGWFAERGVTRFKTPERVIVVDKLPLLSAGKPDRAALRRQLSSA